MSDNKKETKKAETLELTDSLALDIAQGKGTTEDSVSSIHSIAKGEKIAEKWYLLRQLLAATFYYLQIGFLPIKNVADRRWNSDLYVFQHKLTTEKMIYDHFSEVTGIKAQTIRTSVIAYYRTLPEYQAVMETRSKKSSDSRESKKQLEKAKQEAAEKAAYERGLKESAGNELSILLPTLTGNDIEDLKTFVSVVPNPYREAFERAITALDNRTSAQVESTIKGLENDLAETSGNLQLAQTDLKLLSERYDRLKTDYDALEDENKNLKAKKLRKAS